MLSKMRAIGVASIASLGFATSASATTYYFTDTQVAGFGAGPYGEVQLTQDGANVNFTVLLYGDLNFVNTGGPHSVFSFDATGVAAGDITSILFNGVANPLYDVVAPGANTPFGTFTLAIDCTDSACKNGAPGAVLDPLSFTVLNATLSDFVVTKNGLTTAFFAADVICQTTSTSSCLNGATGAIGVPEPGSLALLGLGLAGLSLARRRRAA